MDIFNCTYHEITIEKDSLLGIVERISDDDEVGELNVNEMTVNIQKQQLDDLRNLKAFLCLAGRLSQNQMLSMFLPIDATIDKGFGKCQLLDTIYSKENGVHIWQLG